MAFFSQPCIRFPHNGVVMFGLEYDMIRYDSVYVTCSKKLTGSQLSLPHGINKKLKCETKNNMTSKIGLEKLEWCGYPIVIKMRICLLQN